jgi:hypothetical protein
MHGAILLMLHTFILTILLVYPLMIGRSDPYDAYQILSSFGDLFSGSFRPDNSSEVPA